MMKTFVRAAFAASLLASAATAALVLPNPAYAADDSKNKDKGKAQSDEPAVSKKVGIALYQAQKAMTDGDNATAMQKVTEAEALPDRTPSDDYMIAKFKGYIAINLKDEKTALACFVAMAGSPVLPASEKVSVYQNAMLLSARQKDYAGEIKYGLLLDPLKPLDDRSLAMMSQAYYLTNDFNNSAVYAEKSVAAAKIEGVQPDPVVLEIQMSAQTKQHDDAGALKTLEEIAVGTNEPAQWQQLTALALTTKGIKDLDALYIYRLRFMAGAMKEPDDYTIPAGIALQLGYPQEAKEFMTQGVNTGKISPGRSEAGGLLAKAKGEAATDQASLSSYASSASRAKSGEQDIKLAEDYWGYGRYADAEAAAREGIAKGGLKDSSEGYFILGISLVAQAKNIEAQEPLAKVDGSAARSRAAYLWNLFAQARAKQMGQNKAASTAPAQTAAPAPQQNAPAQH